MIAKVAGVLALLGAVALLIAVYAAKGNLPSFEDMKSSPNGR